MTFNNQKPTLAKLKVAKNPNSKATALRWYLQEHVGLLHNHATEELRAELTLALAKVKGRNAPAIVEICRDCVGSGADGRCRDSIKNCEITNCLLFNVRPYQSKSKVSSKKIVPRAFSRGNSNKVEVSPIATVNPSKTCNLENMVIDCFSLES